ncbi:MAG: hypothetical protein ACU836_08250 [Gammaproteobacteria bacterium]
MSNMPEFNPDDVNGESQAISLLQAVQKHHALVKANRFLLMLVFVLMVVVFAMGLVFLPSHNALLNEIQANRATATHYALQNPVISAEIDALKGQMFGLVSGSIESKLRSLEESIKRGSLADSLNTIQDLKSDVKVLNAYSGSPPVNKTQDSAANQQLIRELTDLKDLVYMTLVSCGLMFGAVACIWFRQRYRISHHKNHSAYLGNSRRN